MPPRRRAVILLEGRATSALFFLPLAQFHLDAADENYHFYFDVLRRLYVCLMTELSPRIIRPPTFIGMTPYELILLAIRRPLKITAIHRLF